MSGKPSEEFILAANLLALCNIAEVEAPGLRNSVLWRASKARLEAKAEELGILDWINRRAEEQTARMLQDPHKYFHGD